jgi:hypothetical protein
MRLAVNHLRTYLMKIAPFTPSQSFIDNANAKSDTYDLANKDRLAFWEKQAERLSLG